MAAKNCQICGVPSGIFFYCKEHKGEAKKGKEKQDLELKNKEIDSPIPNLIPPLEVIDSTEKSIITKQTFSTREEGEKTEYKLGLLWNDLDIELYDQLIKLGQSNKLKTLIATCRKWGKSYGYGGMMLQAVLNHEEANFLYCLKYQNRMQIQGIPMLKSVVYLGHQKGLINNRQLTKILDSFTINHFEGNNQFIYFGSLENSSKNYVPIKGKFGKIIVDELLFQSSSTYDVLISPETQKIKLKEIWDNISRGEKSIISPLTMHILFNSGDLENAELQELADALNVDYRKQDSHKYKESVEILLKGRGGIIGSNEFANYFCASYLTIPKYRFDPIECEKEKIEDYNRGLVVYGGICAKFSDESLMTYHQLKYHPFKVVPKPQEVLGLFGGLDGGSAGEKRDASLLLLLAIYQDKVDNKIKIYVFDKFEISGRDKKIAPSIQAKEFYEKLLLYAEDKITIYCDPKAGFLGEELYIINTRENLGVNSAFLDKFGTEIKNRVDLVNSLIQQERIGFANQQLADGFQASLSDIENYPKQLAKAGERNETKRSIKLEAINCLEYAISQIYYNFQNF